MPRNSDGFCRIVVVEAHFPTRICGAYGKVDQNRIPRVDIGSVPTHWVTISLCIEPVWVFGFHHHVAVVANIDIDGLIAHVIVGGNSCERTLK